MIKRLYLISSVLVFFIFQNTVFGQSNYPLRLTAMVNNPLPNTLENFANPALNPIRIQLQLQDLNLVNSSVFLKIKMESTALTVTSNDAVMALTIPLNPGAVTDVPAVLIAQYFSFNALNVSPAVYSRVLPAGLYTFTFEVYDAQSRVKISDSNSSAPIWLESSQPPVLLQPQNFSDVAVAAVQNVLFQWNPRNANINDIEYEFTLTELPSTNFGNVQNIFFSQPPIFQTTTPSSTLLYNSSFPPLREGFSYAWRVRAKAKFGSESRVGVFENDGQSEVFAFKYISPMLAPQMLQSNWSNDLKWLNLSWQGESNHQQYLVMVYDPNGMEVYRSVTLNNNTNNNHYDIQVMNLSASTRYSYQITAIDAINRRAMSPLMNIDPLSNEEINAKLATLVELKGRCTWGIKDSETTLNSQNELFTTNIEESRKIEKFDWRQSQSSVEKHPLAGANISVFGTYEEFPVEVSILKNDVSNLELLETALSDNNGEFQFRNIRFAQLKDMKHFYIQIKYKNEALAPLFSEIQVNLNDTLLKDVGAFHLLANTVRYSVRILNNNDLLQKASFEEVALYRPRASYEGNKQMLEYEGNVPKNIEWIYNGTSYVKVAELSGNNLTSLFGNTIFGDQYIVKIKERDLEPVIIPINQVENNVSFEESLHFTDFLIYQRPAPTIKGTVSLGTPQNRKPLGYSKKVSIFIPYIFENVGYYQSKSSGLEAYNLDSYDAEFSSPWLVQIDTDENGAYSLQLPEEIVNDDYIQKIAISIDRGEGILPERKLIDKPKGSVTQDFFISSAGITILGKLKDQFNRPISDAIISIANTNLSRTNDKGEFLLNISEELARANEKKLFVMADGYKDKYFSLDDFKVIENKSYYKKNADLTGFKFWNEKVKTFISDNSLQVNANEEVFENAFKNRNINLEKFYSNLNLSLSSNQNLILVKTFVKNNDNKNYISSKINLNTKEYQVPKEGLKTFVLSDSVNIKIMNESDSSVHYFEKNFVVKLPTSSGDKATEIEIMLEEAWLLKGKVVAFSKDSTKIGALAGVSISSTEEDTQESIAQTDTSGHFKLWINKNSASAINFSKTGFNTEKYQIKGVEEKLLEINLYQRDSTIPDFVSLQGIPIILEKIVSIGNQQFHISGKIDAEHLEGEFKLLKGQELTFRGVPVSLDEKDSTNAILIRNELLFDETAVRLLLHNYANVTLSGNPYLKLVKVEATSNGGKGEIVGTVINFTPDQLLGFAPPAYWQETKLVPIFEKVSTQNLDFKNDITKANQKKLEQQQNNKSNISPTVNNLIAVPVDNYYTVFSSDRELLGQKFKLVFPKIKSNEQDVPEGFLAMKVGGPANFTLCMDTSKVILSTDGVKIEGQLNFPSMVGVKFNKYLKISSLMLSNTEALTLKELTFEKANESPFASLGIKNSWRFDVEQIQISDNFRKYAVAGKMFTSKQNFLTVNSFTINEIGEKYYPYLEMSFPSKGYAISNIVFKSPNPDESNIILGYDHANSTYKFDANAIVEVNKGSNPTLKKIFPLEVQKLSVTTQGDFFVSVKANSSVDIGPAQVNIRRILFSKGKTLSWAEMNDMMLRDSSENAKFLQTKRFNNKNYQAVSDTATRAQKAIGDSYLLNTENEISLEDDEASNWVLGFAGGVQFNKLSGARVNSDASFLVGDVGGGVDVKFNSIDVVIESTAFKAIASIQLQTSGDKIGFSGEGQVETIKQKFGASLKLFDLPNGIEFGASLLASTTITTGAITWTAIGGAIDINTETQKYEVTFLGRAHPTATAPEVTEFRNIKLSVLFDAQTCDEYPVISGTMDWYNRNEFYCNISAKLDFCRMMVLGTIDCDKEVVKGSMAHVNATVFFTKNSFFLGATVRTKVLKLEVNGTVMMGSELDFYGEDTPYEVSYYSGLIDSKYLTRNRILNGIYFKCAFDTQASSSGDFWIASYSASYSNRIEAIFVYNWTSNIFVVGAKAQVAINARASFLGVGFGASLAVNVIAEGGYNSGWYFDARAGASLQFVLGNGWGLSCNSSAFDWCRGIPYPCGISCGWSGCSIDWCWQEVPCGLRAKACLNGSLNFSYNDNTGIRVRL